MNVFGGNADVIPTAYIYIVYYIVKVKPTQKPCNISSTHNLFVLWKYIYNTLDIYISLYMKQYTEHNICTIHPNLNNELR